MKSNSFGYPTKTWRNIFQSKSIKEKTRLYDWDTKCVYQNWNCIYQLCRVISWTAWHGLKCHLLKWGFHWFKFLWNSLIIVQNYSSIFLQRQIFSFGNKKKKLQLVSMEDAALVQSGVSPKHFAQIFFSN